MGVGIVLFADELIALLTHDKFTDASPLLVLWVLLIFSVTMGIPYAQYLVAFRRTKFLMITQVLPSSAGNIGLWLAISLFGYYGAAVKILIVSLVIQFARRWAALRCGMAPANDGIFRLAFAVVTTVWAIDWFLQPSFLNEIILFLGITVICLWIIGFSLSSKSM